ncbi:MAG: acetate kinase [Bacteroidota bacterium]
MNILVINSGSSSIKFQLIQMPSEQVTCSGVVERIGLEDAQLKYKAGDKRLQRSITIATHAVGLRKITEILMDPEVGSIKNIDEIDAVGHRVVHGGDSFAETTLVNRDVKKEIQEFATLAPLHNPPNLAGIEIAGELFPKAPQVAVFDTAFHQTMPVKARKYAIPNKFYVEHGIQIYGFHGTSHKYVSQKAMAYLQRKHSKIISVHLGNGCSITAVRDGKSMDHSLGFAPSNGLIMGSRSGDVDHALIFHLVGALGYTLEEVSHLLNKESGMLGLTGHSDLRDIEAKAEKGDKECRLALEMNAYRVKKYIGAYTAAMNGLDALVFTAGIGENSSRLRNLICADMDYLGITLDGERNKTILDSPWEINDASAEVKVLVIPTNEELEIAKQVFGLITG